MTRDNKGRYSKTKRDEEDFGEDPTTPNPGKLLDRPPSIKFILIFLFVTWVSTFIFPGLKEETTRQLSNHICHSEESFRGSYSNTTRAFGSNSSYSKEK